MSGRFTREIALHHIVRKCVRCGYDGSMLQDGHAPQCARCGCDLGRRPARSYAEMEGLIGGRDDQQTARRPPAASRQTRHASGVVERWLWFFFLSMMLLFAIAALAVSAVPGAVG